MERSEIRDPAYATLHAGYGTEALRQARDRPRRAGERRDEEAGFLRLVWIAHVERANAGIEERDERQLPVEHRRHAFVRRMRAEAAAALAEMPARLLDGPVRHHHRPRLDRHVCEPHHLPRLLAFVH